MGSQSRERWHRRRLHRAIAANPGVLPAGPPAPRPPWWRPLLPVAKGLAVVAGLVGVTLVSCWGAR